MADIAPILQPIDPFDGSKGASIYFTYTGSKQSMENNLYIKEADTGIGVYNFNYTGFERVHHIPTGALQNGKKYIAKIRVRFSDETYSPYSNEVTFSVLATPVLDITNIDGQGYVYNSDVTFVANYSQTNGEVVKTYRFNLYDEQEDLMQSYPLRYPTVATDELTEVVNKLEKGKGYFIECIIETNSGFVWSQKEKFIPLYIVPSINGVISTRNDSQEGFVRVTANLKQLLGTQVRVTDPNDTYISDNYNYEDNDWVIVPSDNPVIFKGLGMNRASDFVLKVWCKNVPSGTKFLTLSPKNGSGIAVELWKYNDRILAIKEYNGIVSRHRSNIVLIPDISEFMVYIKAIEHRIDVSLKLL